MWVDILALVFLLTLTPLDNFLPFLSNLKLSSANSFSLEESKICRLVMGYCCFEQYFSYTEVVSEPTHAFLEFLYPVLCTILSKPLTVFPQTTVETMDSGGRGKID